MIKQEARSRSARI